MKYGGILCVTTGTVLGSVSILAPLSGCPMAILLPLLMVAGFAAGTLAAKTDGLI